MIGGNVMQDDEAAFKMLCTAYEEYGINFYDVGELDPLPHAPQHHGSGHRGVLRRFFRKYRSVGSSRAPAAAAAAAGAPAADAADTAAAPAAAAAEGALRAEAQQLFISVRVLSGALGPFDYERLALERRRREAAAAAAMHAAAAAGKDPAAVAAAAAAAAQEASLSVRTHSDGYARWAPPMGWKELEAAVDGMLQRLEIDCIDLLQLSDPHRYVPRQELGEDTYCWGVRYIGVSNETAYGIYKWVQAAEEMNLPRIIAAQQLYNIMHRNELETSGGYKI
ncbi:hypothetical protein EBH_0017810 [Eimeria brunetti]|uniref:NADP-dependent oxidoreductase domain-containing protein n=1 Tax=Eimeria brunetti TaxID=51314 RepID=U6LJ19_9EIME|nr:hypothetical protein EBH_0017810 [Eimeria brunetti]